MRLAFALYKYFPYGGLARDFLRIARRCLEKGHTVDVYVMKWEDATADGLTVHVLPSKGLSNHSRVADFHRQLADKLQNENYDGVIGFNKIPNLDVYYAADPCYIERFENASVMQKLNPRYKFYSSVERQVFGVDSQTVCLMISDVQATLFRKYYGVADERLVMLPPGIDIDRRRPENVDDSREKFREEHGFSKEDIIILLVGSGFKTKGVDRAILSLASLPSKLKKRTTLMIVGEGKHAAYKRLAAKNKVTDNVRFMGGRADVPEFLLGADVLVHPARKENTGTAILEAMVAGLPMLVTEVCGYAKHVKNAQAGIVLREPFVQEELNQQLNDMLLKNKDRWIKNALHYAETEDLYSMPKKAVDSIEKIITGRMNAV
ncbi:MAG: UDP-glucose--LPS alpha 1,3-glucosyltransferase WaaG [Piscirickettsiaceae bacterium]|nr:MAG: UDP-glucose--LPS alpha 1,3-glucosyltransferase WaaG [Piscirickettsiaceae bacterium]